MKLTLLGEKLSHSLSPQIHALALKALGLSGNYTLSEVNKQDLASFMAAFKGGAFDGMNVTIPYKTDVMPYLDELTNNARVIGAVNTILRVGDTLKGYNTDYDGFGELLKNNFLSVEDEAFAVLGAGGAAKSVVLCLLSNGASCVTVYTRSVAKAKRAFYGHAKYGKLRFSSYNKISLKGKTVVNTTPLGMHPHTGASPLKLQDLSGAKAVVDLVYNPATTRLMQLAAEQKIPTFNGLYMLVAQAVSAQEVWQGRRLKACLTRGIYNKLSKAGLNIVLIGMPGCGKTAIGKALAKRLDTPVLDMDAYIENHYGSIPTLFNKGEDYFRDVETKVAKLAATKRNTVVCTGGGVIKRAQNMCALASTATVVFIDRPLKHILNDIDHSTRPLLNGDKSSVTKLYAERIDLYRKYAHCVITNDDKMQDAIDEILSYVEGTR